jgi:hypothetical protein
MGVDCRGIILYARPRVPECLSHRQNWVPPPSNPLASVSPPSNPKGEINTLLRVRGWGDPTRTTGEKAWHSAYSVGMGMYARIDVCKSRVGERQEL